MKSAVCYYFFSIVMMSAVLWVMRCVLHAGLICGCLPVISGSITWFLVSFEDGNKPLDDLEWVIYRRRARGILLFEIAFLIISLL